METLLKCCALGTPLPHPTPGPDVYREAFWFINRAAVTSRAGPVPRYLVMTEQQKAAL